MKRGGLFSQRYDIEKVLYQSFEVNRVGFVIRRRMLQCVHRHCMWHNAPFTIKVMDFMLITITEIE